MPESFIQLPADSTGKRLRTRQQTIASQAVQEQYVIPVNERVVSGVHMVSSFRTLGTAATNHNLFTIENPTGSSVLMAVRRMSIQLDATAVLTAVAPTVGLSRTTAIPTGGTTLAATKLDTNDANAVGIARGATASHGGAASAITATSVAGALGWQQFTMRMHTLVGQIMMDDQNIAPLMAENTPIILRAGQALLVNVTSAVGTSNPNTNHWITNCLWEEFTLP